MNEETEDSAPCPKCADGTHPFKCFICEHPGSIEYYRSRASIEEVCGMVLGIKLCTPHAQELDQLQTHYEKREIERAVA